MIKTYSELIKIESFDERLRYLQTASKIGVETFGGARFLNQDFYRSKEWHCARRSAILRDQGFDLGIEGIEIYGTIYVHHINPLKPEDIIQHRKVLFDPENLICCSYETHQRIHFSKPEEEVWKPRTKNDTCPWK